MVSCRHMLLTLFIVSGITARPLADVRGSELIRDTAEDITKLNFADENAAHTAESLMTLSHIQNMISVHGENSTCSHLEAMLDDMYLADASRALKCLKTLINEENGLISCLIQQLQMYFTPETVSNDITSQLELTKQGYPADAMHCASRLQNTLSQMMTTNTHMQYNMPTPATLDALIQAAFTGYTHCQTIKDIAYRHNFIITSAPTIGYDKLASNLRTVTTLIVTNARLLSHLEPQIESIHLRPYNKAYRYLCSATNKIPKAKLAWTGAIGSFAFLWGLRYIDVESEWLRSIKQYLHGPLLDPKSSVAEKLTERIDTRVNNDNSSEQHQPPRNPFDRRALSQFFNQLSPQAQQQNYSNIAQTDNENEIANKAFMRLHQEAGENGNISLAEVLADWKSYYPFTTFCSNLLSTPLGYLTLTARIIYDITSSLNQSKEVEEYIPIYTTIREQLYKLHHNLRGYDTHNMKQLQYHYNITLEDKRFDTMRETLEPFYRILDYMNSPAKYTHGGLTVPKNILITGPSGCGKSFAAQAFGNSLDKQLKITGHGAVFHELEKTDWFNINDMGAANAVQEIIAWAKMNSPCVIFIDEIHTYDLQDNTNSTFLNQLLTGLDHLDLNRDPEQQVFVIGATNRPEKLDPALLRPGRFGTRISLSYPGHEQRKNIIQARCEQLSIDLEQTDIDLDYLANLTAGASLSSIEKMFEQATFNARSDNQPVTLEYFYKALNRIIRKIIPNTNLSESEVSHLAANIASQSIIQHLHKPESLDAATICAMNVDVREVNAFFDKADEANSTQKDHIAYGGLFFNNEHEHITNTSPEQRKLHCKQLLAGKAGEELLTGKRSSYRQEDAATAYETALEIVCDDMPFKQLSEQKQNEKRDEAYHLYNHLQEEARAELNQHINELSELQTQLMQEQFLHKPAIEAILTEKQPGQA